MWSRIAVLVFALFHPILGGEIYDVTTIYNVTDLCTSSDTCVTAPTGQIHVRTNALGLPLYDGNDHFIVPKDSQMFNITCDPLEETCSWDTKKWDTFINSDKYNAEGKAYKIRNKKLRLSFQSNDGGFKYLYFTLDDGSIEGVQGMCMVLFRYSYNYPEIYDCKNKNINFIRFNLKDRDSSRVGFDCTHQGTFSSFNYENDVLTFHFDEGKIQMYRGDKAQSLQFTWSSPTGSVANYWSMSADNNFHQFKTSVQEKVLTGVEGSEIVSPLFIPDSRQLCLVFLLHSKYRIIDELLHLFALDVFDNRHLIQRISDFQDGLNVKHVNIALESNVTSPVKLVLRKVGAQNVTVVRISSCNPEGEEVEFLNGTTPYNSLLRRDLPAYRPWFGFQEILGALSRQTRRTWHSQDEELLSTDQWNSRVPKCLNGGVMNSGVCSCPPGFSGYDCISGCGRNRFGQDCGGLCSFHPQECKGLLLCTQNTPCRCAPGYTGRNCTTECSPGWYGNDCQQTCGHCISGLPCNMYTGECTACEPGFILPHCKKAHVYYASNPELSTPDYSTITVSFNPHNYISSQGTPELYQIQYKEKLGHWRIFITKSIKNNDADESVPQSEITEVIDGLKTGILYTVRVLLIDANFNKYDGDLVQESQILTKCDIPDAYDYKITYVSNSTSFVFTWKYTNDSNHWCPLEWFEVSWKEGWKWLTTEVYQTEFGQETYILADFLPRSTIRFRVRAKTTGGFAPYSKIVWASTRHEGTSAVRNLRVLSSRSTAVGISWDPPKDSDVQHLQYTVTYKCLEQPACSPGCNDAAEGQVTATDTSLTLSPLLPFAQYLVTVTPEDGLKSSFYVGTSKSVPTETPSLSTQTAVRTNTSLTVFWDKVPVCSSFLLGYNYQLVKKSDSLKVLNSGMTKDTSITFHNLTASTDYIVKVFVVTVAGWNPESYLAINVSTSATVPEAVQNLTIYKRGRNMLGLRWSEPRAIYGKLKSFTIKHTLGHDVTTHTIEPTSCTVWPELYCHTIDGLKSNKKYNVSVSVRNAEVPEDGVSVEVMGVTKESSPTVPENLKLVNTSSSSVRLQWQYPNLANGIIRSFLVSVEETEKYDQESCCQVYPLVETAVKEEAQLYEAEVSGLHPASTYFVSVSAKTVGLGPPQSLTVYTRPPHLPFTTMPHLELSEELSWQPQKELPEVNNSEEYSSLIKAHLLLAVLNDTQSLTEVSWSGLFDKQLSSLLTQMIPRPFFFVTEYNQDDMVSLDLDVNESGWGQSSGLTMDQQYQLVAVQLTEYNGVYNADLRYSIDFTL